MSHDERMTPADVHKHVRVYLLVFLALALLTIVTVAVSYLHLSIMWAVLVAMIVACAKGSLVAAFFMHLISERTAIYATLVLVAAFFVMLMLIPVFTHSGNVVAS